ncbi:lipase 3-like [Musca autumnalis]|uniref:lipase 3-like n=1 Tax=Musca autumnalis TaxID=221902 RepID=UPI003CE900EF
MPLKAKMKTALILILVGVIIFQLIQPRIAKNTCDRVIQHGYPCEVHTVTTKDGYLLTMFRIPGSPLMASGDEKEISTKPPVLLMHGTQCSSDMWVLNGPNDGLPYLLANAGYDVWIGNIRGNYIHANQNRPNVGSRGILCHVKARLPNMLAPIFGRPGILATIFGSLQGNSFGNLIRTVFPSVCRQNEALCVSYLQNVVGQDSPYINRTLLPEFFSTYPAGTSPRLTLHFFQLVNTCQFRAYDFGPNQNLQKYGKTEPPAYDLSKIKLKSPIELYFSDNDYLATIEDVRHLWKIMGDQVSLHRLNLSKYNHFDFVLSENVKTIINDCVVDKMQEYEGRSFNGSLCNNFRNKAF